MNQFKKRPISYNELLMDALIRINNGNIKLALKEFKEFKD